MSARAHLCVIGAPVAQSLSPVIHNHWLREAGIDASYAAQHLEPDALDEFLASLLEPNNKCIGVNITIPHKQRVYDFVMQKGELDDLAQRMGAVNTLRITNGRVEGFNTDGAGFLASLSEAAPRWKPKAGPAVILGAGGAARAIGVALAEKGVPELRIANRTEAHAEEIARLPALSGIGKIIPWSARADALAGAALLVNATSLGMAGAPPLELALDRLPPDSVVADIVYKPLHTPLLVAAGKRGLARADGLGMLLHQAAASFFLWFGKTPTITPELRKSLETRI